MKTILVNSPVFCTNGEEIVYDNSLEATQKVFTKNNKIVKRIQVGTTGIKNYNKIINNRKNDNLILFLYDINHSTNEVKCAFVENSDFEIEEKNITDEGIVEDIVEDIDSKDEISIHIGNGGYNFSIEKSQYKEICVPVLKIGATSLGHKMNDMEIKMTPEYLRKMGEYFISESKKSKNYYNNPNENDHWNGFVGSKFIFKNYEK